MWVYVSPGCSLMEVPKLQLFVVFLAYFAPSVVIVELVQ